MVVSREREFLCLLFMLYMLSLRNSLKTITLF